MCIGDQEGKEGEFLSLFTRHSRQIYGFILTLVMRHSDADEVFQNTCLVLWKKFGSYDPAGTFYGWACKIAYLEVLELRRKQQRVQVLSEEAIALLSDQMLQNKEHLNARQEALEECLQQLNSGDRELIDQRYHQKRSPKEIADFKARSVHAIYRALARIHMALFNCVERHLAREEAR
ncbi:MAG TPA: sigma-70 family RNA polymerase sigma factor [Lacipirellulaceae bacterium]|jgi:RNA polymerase sigma-70 factor (ECF subfamily)